MSQGKHLPTPTVANYNLGHELILLLGLKVKHNGRVDTSWGDKTAKGLGATVRRIVNEFHPIARIDAEGAPDAD